jgi:hypothetical protein
MQGQTDPRVKAFSRGSGYGLFLTADESVVVLTRNSGKSAAIRMKLLGAKDSRVVPTDPLPGTVNSFIGNDPSKWRTDVPTFSKVKYEGIYSGVDLIYYGNQQQLEYDFVVAPGADPQAIRFAVSGAKVRLDSSGRSGDAHQFGRSAAPQAGDLSGNRGSAPRNCRALRKTVEPRNIVRRSRIMTASTRW